VAVSKVWPLRLADPQALLPMPPSCLAQSSIMWLLRVIRVVLLSFNCLDCVGSNPVARPMIWYLYVCCRCSALVHHGGVGTTAAGLHCGKPTMVVPAFGDLFLFVDMCHQVRESSCIGCYITILLSACEQPAVCATAQTASVLRVASVLAAGLAPIVCCSAVCQNLSCHGSARVGVTHKLPRSVYLLLPVSQLPNAAGCGPAAIPLTELTAERLLAALLQQRWLHS
jgi:hypothetical protein